MFVPIWKFGIAIENNCGLAARGKKKEFTSGGPLTFLRLSLPSCFAANQIYIAESTVKILFH